MTRTHNPRGKGGTGAWQIVSTDIDPELKNKKKNHRKSKEGSRRKLTWVHFAATDCCPSIMRDLVTMKQKGEGQHRLI